VELGNPDLVSSILPHFPEFPLSTFKFRLFPIPSALTLATARASSIFSTMDLETLDTSELTKRIGELRRFL